VRSRDKALPLFSAAARLKRALLLFLPALVFVIALTAPGGEHAFRAGPLAEVSAGQVPQYVHAANKTLHLYSSPYASWRYPGAVVVRLFYPTSLLASSTCGAVAASSVGGRPGAYPVDVTIPPGFQGDCWVNFTHPSGWRDAVLLRVRLIDWYPGAGERAVIVLNGTGWQFVQVGHDGTLYVWERPAARSPVAGCVFVFNGSVLLAEAQPYSEVVPGVMPPVTAPSGAGAVRYGAFLSLAGASTLYIYRAPCAVLGRLNVSGPPPLAAEIGALIPTPAGPVFDAPRVEKSVVYRSELRVINYSEAAARTYRLYAYTYSTPVGLWGAVLRHHFTLTALLTTRVSLFRPGGEPERAGDAWVYHAGNVSYWVYGPRPHYVCEPPCGVPAGWQDPVYVVADPTGQWRGWPQILAIRGEVLKPWRP